MHAHVHDTGKHLPKGTLTSTYLPLGVSHPSILWNGRSQRTVIFSHPTIRSHARVNHSSDSLQPSYAILRRFYATLGHFCKIDACLSHMLTQKIEEFILLLVFHITIRLELFSMLSRGVLY